MNRKATQSADKIAHALANISTALALNPLFANVTTQITAATPMKAAVCTRIVVRECLSSSRNFASAFVNLPLNIIMA